MPGNFLFVHVNEWADLSSPDTIPISQGYILARLKQAGFSGRILGDYQDRPLEPGVFKAALQELRHRAVGFSVYQENMDKVRLWASFAKQVDPEITVVLGGPQVTFMPGEALLQMKEADILCRGDGEEVMVELARTLTGSGRLGDVPGICFLDRGEVTETEVCLRTDSLDRLPSPYLDGTLECRGKARAIMLSSRGCTSSCTFCYTPRACGRTVRFHSVDRVIEEMRCLHERDNITDFWFADPNFAWSRQRLEEFLHAIIDQAPWATFWCQTRYNLVDRDLLALLKQAGAHTIAFGLESADRTTLKRIRKGLDPEGISRAIRLTREAGIGVELFTLFGLPGETPEKARRTLDFVRAHDVEISGNSISQQLHLFFGTPVADDPARHGITPLPRTRPLYLSIGRDYHTDSMSEEEIRQMGVLWRLNRKDFADDLAAGTNLFTIAGFITRHKKLLDCRPEADMMLASIYRQLDEPGPAAACLRRLRENFGHLPQVREILRRPFLCYRNRRRAVAKRGCRIIFDCKGLLDGEVIPETVCHFEMATLGDGRLLPDFEQGMEGVKAGGLTQIMVRFPADYGNPRLAGQEVAFHVFLHQVLEPVVRTDLAEIEKRPPRNMYRFDDLFNLKKHNENLYYMVLRDSVLHSYTGNLPHMMALFNYYLKLGFTEKALDLAATLPDEPSVMGHAGRVLLANGLAEEALEYLRRAADTSAEMENQRLKAHMALHQWEEAERIGADPRLATSLQTMHLRVQLAARGRLPVAEYLRRMDRFLDSQVRMMMARA